MGLLQQPVEKKLSALVGAQVTFENLSVSLLTASVDARGVGVAGDDPAAPVLTVKRVRLELALARALKKEFVVKSLTIERPVLSVVRRADGTTNLPRRLTAGEVADEVVEAAAGAPKADNSDDGDNEAPRSWKLEARKVLLVDGEVHFRDECGPNCGYHLSAERITAEVKESDDGGGGGGALEFTCIVDSLGRRDGAAPADLGEVKFSGTADNVADLSQWSSAGVRATLDIGHYLRARVRCPSVIPFSAEAELNGSVLVAAILPLLPAALAGLAARLGAAAAGGGSKGRVELSAKATYDADAGLRVPELTVRATDLAFGARPVPEPRPQAEAQPA